VTLTGVSHALGAEASRPVFVLLVPLVIWPAFRFSPFATALVTTALSVVVVWSAGSRR